MNTNSVEYVADKRSLPHVKTSDLFYGAYLLSSGSRLEGVAQDKADRRRIEFEFSSPAIERLAFDYISGEATVNVNFLKASLKHLKDILFEKMRER
jgi:hypothetical protein